MLAALSGKDYIWYNSSENRGVAGKPIRIGGKTAGAVVVSTVATNAENVLFNARRELTYAFWIALAASTLLGALFSEVIAYQVRALTRGAHEIARGKFDHRLKGFFLPDEMGGLVNSFNMMAERLKRAFEAIKAQEREMSAVIANMSEGVLEVDGEGRLRLANQAAAKLLGFEANDIIGKKLDEVANDGIRDIVSESLAGKLASGVSHHGDRVILINAAPMRDENQNAIASVVIMSDVTEQKRLEQAQKDFISNASHELRTPISSLKGFVELLEGGAKEKKDVRDSFLRTMRTEIDRLARLVDELLVLAQYDSGTVKLKLERCDVGELMGDVYSIASPIADSSGIGIVLNVEASLPKVTCDRDKIVQVLLIFVDNAIKHSDQGKTIKLEAKKAPDGKVELSVIDEGPGIAPEEMDKIFDRFYHKPNAKTAPKGAGLGLSIAREIVDAHGSTIQVDSNPGKGSRFSFSLKTVADESAKPQPSLKA